MIKYKRFDKKHVCADMSLLYFKNRDPGGSYKCKHILSLKGVSLWRQLPKNILKISYNRIHMSSSVFTFVDGYQDGTRCTDYFPRDTHNARTSLRLTRTLLYSIFRSADNDVSMCSEKRTLTFQVRTIHSLKQAHLLE